MKKKENDRLNIQNDMEIYPNIEKENTEARGKGYFDDSRLVFGSLETGWRRWHRDTCKDTFAGQARQGPASV